MSTAVKSGSSESKTPRGATKPQTGNEYLDSLRDDRTVFIYGERVKDVTTHPAFRNTARMVARRQDPRLLQGAEIAR
jgi:4-hydroxyphenylacetate 3-hydroxylase-like protein